MGSTNGTKGGSIDRKCTRLRTSDPGTQQILQSETYLIARAASTAPRLSHAYRQANPKAYKPRRILQARTAFSVLFPRERAGSPNLLQSVARLPIRSLLPWMPVTLSHN